MSSITGILAANNTMPWFLPPVPVLTTFDLSHWLDAVAAIDGQTAAIGDMASFAIYEPSSTVIGVGEVGATYPQTPGYEYRSMPWSPRMILLSSDVLVLVRVSLRHQPRIRDVVKHWLAYHGVYTSFDPSSNDMLINNRKFLGVKAYDTPLGWRTEFAMMTIHKDETAFAEALPEDFQTNRRGYKLTGLADEVPFDIVLTLPSLYQAERGDI